MDKNRIFIFLGCVIAALFTPLSVPVFGQTSFALDPDSAKQSFAPSPLSGFETIPDQPAYYSTTIGPNQFVSHSIDLRDVLKAYSADNQCSMNEAFAAVAKKLQMVPLDPNNTDQSKLKNAIYRSIQNDVYSITARQVFFNELQSNLYQLQYGNRQIVIEVSFVLVPVQDVEVLQSFMVPNTFQAFGNQLPQVVPESTFATVGNSQQNQSTDPQATGTRVSTSETKNKALPTFIGKLDTAGVNQLVRFSKSRSNMEIAQAPTLTVFPGTRATVTDVSMLPFVVSVKRIEHKLGVSYQPVSQSIEDGTKMMFRAELKGEKIQMVGDLVFSKILGVETFDYPYAKGKDGNTVTIQVPEHQVRKVHWSTTLESGNTLLIDPVDTFEKQIKPKTRTKPAVNQTMRRLIMIKPTLVNVKSDQENEGAGLSPIYRK